ncbi:putative atrophin-1 incomplete domain containing protein [Pandoravirus japonicus]|uniref:Atrophin-1 incomplete domain containing protein n=1 Tax=Pandoravirus japonicus TaxID=2823154 RepID=A0A811BMN3_9VIRU|nr:putative atrophin-1 incomplete domain containing protein [Pandoravirus japonicus]
MEGIALVTVWTADVDEKPLAVTVPCQDGGAIFGTLQALIAHAYASAHPDRPALRFWPDGSYVATNAAREPLFHADQKVPLSTLRRHAMPIFFLYDCSFFSIHAHRVASVHIIMCLLDIYVSRQMRRQLTSLFFSPRVLCVHVRVSLKPFLARPFAHLKPSALSRKKNNNDNNNDEKPNKKGGRGVGPLRSLQRDPRARHPDPCCEPQRRPGGRWRARLRSGADSADADSGHGDGGSGVVGACARAAHHHTLHQRRLLAVGQGHCVRRAVAVGRPFGAAAKHRAAHEGHLP